VTESLDANACDVGMIDIHSTHVSLNAVAEVFCATQNGRQ